MENLIKIFRSVGVSPDHIIPINGKNVSGLNVPWNLQAVNHNQNKSKNNWFCPQLYEIWVKSGEVEPFLKPNT